jgi:hypothetical protein
LRAYRQSLPSSSVLCEATNKRNQGKGGKRPDCDIDPRRIKPASLSQDRDNPA